MSSTSRYSALVNEHRSRAEIIQKQQKKADALLADIDMLKNKTTDEINDFIVPRLEYLAKVGRSTLSKCWGVAESELLPLHANGFSRWTLYEFTVIKITDQNIYIQGKRANHEKLFVLPKDYLQFGNRDFAKNIRSSMKFMKKWNKEADEKKSAKEIAEIKSQMRVLQWELNSLERKAKS